MGAGVEGFGGAMGSACCIICWTMAFAALAALVVGPMGLGLVGARPESSSSAAA